MLYLHISTDEQGESHISEVEPSFYAMSGYAQGVPPVGLSASQRAGVVHFLRLPCGWEGDFHAAPARQFVVQLQGRLEVTTSDGTSVITGPATAWLVEDTEGRGHRTKVVSEEDSVALVVTLT